MADCMKKHSKADVLVSFASLRSAYESTVETMEYPQVNYNNHGHQSISFIAFYNWIKFLCFCSVLCLLCLCVHLFICALWSSAGKGLTSWLSFVLSNCEFVTFPLVSWVRCGT